MWLYMAVIIHGAWLTRLNHIGFAFTGHGIHITGLTHTIIARTCVIHIGMIYAMQMDRVGQVMGVF